MEKGDQIADPSFSIFMMLWQKYQFPGRFPTSCSVWPQFV
ncbi:hypothetical protein VRK_39610 [Vibrio sp. MEBiC08052]|nr:hypothetical protein VRK_39610 [Vibrio sp. MEBiC08052]